MEVTPEPRGRDRPLYFIAWRCNHASKLKQIIGIVAKPGDTVAFSADTLAVNGEALDMFKRAPSTGNGHLPPGSRSGLVVLGPGEYFVMGDDPARSQDSRNFGPVKRRDILGKPLYIYFSSDFSRIGNKL